MGQIDYIDTSWMMPKEPPNVTVAKVEVEYSITWMRTNPELAGKSLEKFLRENAHFKTITARQYPSKGFVTFSAFNDPNVENEA